jgi:hypothetical protein
MNDLSAAIRASLNAKLERLLERPLIARIVPLRDSAPPTVVPEPGAPSIFQALQRIGAASAPSSTVGLGAEDPKDGTYTLRIAIDYDDLWRGREKEVAEQVSATVENYVTFLTDEQVRLLERSPREFLALETRPESVELVHYETSNVGNAQHVVLLRCAAAPESRHSVRHVAIVPNMVQLERQLAGLQVIESADDDGPLAPLRALVGLSALPGDVAESAHPSSGEAAGRSPSERLDEFQSACVHKALNTPNFAVIQGPPGSGKTTVISSVVRGALARGERVLVVSPTHVAVDNVVEKLTPAPTSTGPDELAPETLPVRYASRVKKLSPRALDYWVGRKKEHRGATVAVRVQRRLEASVPFARMLFAHEDAEAAGVAPISRAVASVEKVVCGTPIGILSYDPVKLAGPATFDLLIVDEVSKMTLPEFLAIAVKARRWVLVGDPEQLPPYNDAEDNATTLDDVFEPWVELECSVAAILERCNPEVRRDQRLLVVSSSPELVAEQLRERLHAHMPGSAPRVSVLYDGAREGIVVCALEDYEAAGAGLSPARGRDHTHNPESQGSLRVLVERGLRVARPPVASGRRLVEPRLRAQAALFETCFNVYHAQPWSLRSAQKLRLMKFRNGLRSYLPADPALVRPIAERLAVNMVSVYDWLTGMPERHFDTSPLTALGQFQSSDLQAAVRPFVGTLKKQYRMHSTLSAVPRELFYFGEALHDGAKDEQLGCRVQLLQVQPPGTDAEWNDREITTICNMLRELGQSAVVQERPPGIMIITPYRQQESRMNSALDRLRAEGVLDTLEVEVCTLDRCQGREAEYVFISLVRSKATPFLDMPKRWNVALTRAMQGLFIVGNIESYLAEATSARWEAKRGSTASGPARPLMSMLARILEAYNRQIVAHGRATVGRDGKEVN